MTMLGDGGLASELQALAPLLILAAAAVLAMLAAAFSPRPRAALILTLAGLALALAALPWAAKGEPQVTDLLRIDDYALFFMALNIAAAFAIALLISGYFGANARPGAAAKATPPEATPASSPASPAALYVLLLAATLGAAVLCAASHFATLFLGLELLSVALFAMIAYARDEAGIEGGIKYLVLAGAASGFLLFGMALIYARAGTMAFAELADLAAMPADGYAIAGLALLLVGIGYKLALIPFHMWTPDVYQGAPAPVAAFIATVSKGAALALLLRLFLAFADGWRDAEEPPLASALAIIAAVSMLAGNLLALLQDNIKRVLAYSSIAHLGYLLLALLAAPTVAADIGLEALAYYLAAYFVAMVGAFGIVGATKAPGGGELVALDDYRGLFWRQPGAAAILTFMLLSLAGIPLTMGFIAKFYVIAAAVAANFWLLVAALLIGSVIGLFYYLRIVAAMCAAEASPPPPKASLRPGDGIVLGALTLVLLVLGIYPAPLIALVTAAMAGAGM